jgi:hypothetical protein
LRVSPAASMRGMKAPLLADRARGSAGGTRMPNQLVSLALT